MSDYKEVAAQNLRTQFELVSKNIPTLTMNCTPLAMGGQAMVIEHQDETVSKIFWKSSFATHDAFENEVEVLRLINGNTFGNAKTPEIVDIIRPDENEMVYAAYRMTKLGGNELNWQEFIKSESPPVVEKHFRETGALLAEFHSKMQDVLGERVVPERGFKWGHAIQAVPSLDEKVNHALSICSSHYDEAMQAGVNHGDFHCGNFRVDDNFTITGLFDFSFTGGSPNHLMDFTLMPDDAAVFSLKEYEAITGDSIDIDMMKMTQLSLSAATINHWATQPDIDTPLWIQQQFYKRLDDLQHITGLSFNN